MDNALLQRAGLLIQHRRFADASEVLMQSLSQNPNDPMALRLLGICQFSRDDNKAALTAFQQAIAADPEDADLRVWLARAQLELKQPAEAHRTLDEAQGMDPDFSEIHSARAQVFYHQTRWAEAEQAALQALNLDADDLTAQNVLSHVLIMQGRQEESEAHIHQRFTRDPENEQTHVAAGYAALRRGDHKAAATHFKEALRLDPDNEAAREGLLTSFRARSVIYRSLLAFSFRIAQLQEKYRQWLFLGLFIVYKVVVAALQPISPALATVVIVLYAVFVLWSYVARGIGTLFILGDHDARLALRRSEKWEGFLVGGAAVAGLLLIVVSLIITLPIGQFQLGLVLAAMSIPWSLTFSSSDRGGRILYGSFAAIATVGMVLVLIGGFPPGSSALRGLGIIAAALSASVPTFLAMFGILRK
jgi:tetratricopeptide (TPR) repeat protein